MEKKQKYVVANINDVAFYPAGTAPDDHLEPAKPKQVIPWKAILVGVGVVNGALLIANLVVELT